MAGIMKTFGEKTTKTIGDFWRYFVLNYTRILLLMALLIGCILITQGMSMEFDGKIEVAT